MNRGVGSRCRKRPNAKLDKNTDPKTARRQNILDQDMIEGGWYHCLVTDWFDEGVYDFGEGFCRDPCSAYYSWVPIHALFPRHTRLFHGGNACTWRTAILQVLL
jgi:hypothetical protein